MQVGESRWGQVEEGDKNLSPRSQNQKPKPVLVLALALRPAFCSCKYLMASIKNFGNKQSSHFNLFRKLLNMKQFGSESNRDIYLMNIMLRYISDEYHQKTSCGSNVVLLVGLGKPHGD